MNDLGATQLSATRALLRRRQDEIIGSICKLVETESPSEDFEGSRAVVDLLVESARTIPAISAVERIPVPGYGEHLRVRAFDGQADDTPYNVGAWAYRYGSPTRHFVHAESAGGSRPTIWSRHFRHEGLLRSLWKRCALW